MAARAKPRALRPPRWAPSAVALIAALAAMLAAHPAPAHVYWGDADAGGAIGRAALDGTPLPGGQWLPGVGQSCGVAVNAAHVYWTSRAGTIGRARLDGTSIEPSFVVLPGGSACGIAVNDSHLYWASSSSGKLGRANLDGTAVQAAWMSPGSGHGCGVAVDASRVYWATATGVYSAPLGGGSPTTISKATSDNCGIAVNAAHVYWATAEGFIERSPLGGGPPTPVVKAPLAPCGVALDARHVYWGNSASDTIGRANLDGSGLDQRFAEGARSPCGVAVDGLGLAAQPTSPNRARPPSNAFWLGRAKRNRRRGTARLRVFVPGPGSIRLDGRMVQERFAQAELPFAHTTPAGIGRLMVPVAPERLTKALLKRGGSTVVGVGVTYTPSGGAPRTHSTRVRLVLRRQPAGGHRSSAQLSGCSSIGISCSRSQGNASSSSPGYLPSK